MNFQVLKSGWRLAGATFLSESVFVTDLFTICSYLSLYFILFDYMLVYFDIFGILSFLSLGGALRGRNF